MTQKIPDAPGDGVRLKRTSYRSFPESFMKIGHEKSCQDSTCPPSLFLESWRTWRFLMHLVMVSDGWEHPKEVSLKVSWILDIRKPVKTPPVLQVSSWSLGGRGGSWPTLWWSQMEANIQEKLPWKVHEVWTSETLSRLPLSSKSLPGVLEDMEVPDEEGSGWGVTFVTKRISLDNVLNNIGLIWDLQKEITNVTW